MQFVAIPADTYSAPVYSEEFTVFETGVRAILNVTALAASSVNVHVELKDPASGTWFDLGGLVSSGSVQIQAPVFTGAEFVGTIRFKATVVGGGSADFSLSVVFFA